MTDLTDLAARVEGLSGPCREMDAAIYYDLLGFCRHARIERSGAQSDTGFDCLDCGADSWGNKSDRGQRLHDKPRPFTASLDAAMTLRPDHACVTATFYGKTNCVKIVAPGCDVTAVAATPALALVAAALRAKEMTDG